MQTFEAIEKRRNIRMYKDQPIGKEKISKLVEAARLATTAGNRQKFNIERSPRPSGRGFIWKMEKTWN